MGLEALNQEYSTVVTELNKLRAAKQPLKRGLIEKQCKILEQIDDEYVKSGNENIEDYTARIRVNSILKYWSEKLGLPTDKYVANIDNMEVKMGIEK